MTATIRILKDFRHRAGRSFVCDLDVSGDSMSTPSSSRLRLFEDGTEIGPAHSAHAQVEQHGNGRFSHWNSELYFSSSDGSSPLMNGRTYSILLEEETRTAIDRGTFLALQSGVLRYRYRDVWLCKSPIDLALYQLLIWRERPKTILELGTLEGGSAVWFADLMRTYGIDGRIHSLDIDSKPKIRDPLVSYYYGDVLNIEATWSLDWIKTLPRPILAVEDSGHQFEMSLAAITYMAKCLVNGEYLVVEDGIATPMGEDAQFNGGPLRAIDEFLSSRHEFIVDRSLCDFFGRNVTWSVDGFLRRTSVDEEASRA